MIKFLKRNVIFLIILLSGSFLRLYNISYDNLWYDEILSFWIANPQYSISESFEFHNKTEPNTFSFHFLLKVFYKFFDYNPDYLRYLSAFFGILSIFLSLKIAKLFNFNQMKNLIAFLIAFNIFLIAYSQEGRVYSILFFFCFLSIIYFIKIQMKGINKKKMFLFFTFTITSIFLHPFALLILFSYSLFLILRYLILNTYDNNLNYLILSIFLCSLVFYYFSLTSLNHTHTRHFWISNPDISFYTNFFFSNFFGSRLMGVIFLLFLIILGIKERKLIKKINNITLLLIIIFLSYLLPIIFGYIFKPVLIPRYVIFILIPILTIICFFCSRVSNKKIKYFLISFLILITISNHFTEQTFKQFYNKRVVSKPEYIKAVSHINNSGYYHYFIKVEDMISDLDSIKAIDNYISTINEKLPNKLILINNSKIKKFEKPIWHF